MARFFILVGYFELMMYLYLSGKLNQYINLHYAYLAYLSIILSLLLALVQLTVWVKQLSYHSHLHSKIARVGSLILLAIPLFVGVFFPVVTLDSQTVSAKGFHFPLAAGANTAIQDIEGTTNQYLKPDTSLYFTKTAYDQTMHKAVKKYLHKGTIYITTQNYMEFMELLYNYPNEFIGKKLDVVGFVYHDPSNHQNQFLFRFGIIHCIADSGVYGILTMGQQRSYPNNTWIHAVGTITLSYHQKLGQHLPTLQLEVFQKVKKPSNPYVYRVF